MKTIIITTIKDHKKYYVKETVAQVRKKMQEKEGVIQVFKFIPNINTKPVPIGNILIKTSKIEAVEPNYKRVSE